MLGSRPSPKNSFLAKQEFFEKKEQENKERNHSLAHRQPTSPTSKEIGVPIMVLSSRKSDSSDNNSPRSDVASDSAFSPRSDVSITPRENPVTPRGDSTKSSDAVSSPEKGELKVEIPKYEEKAKTPVASPVAEQAPTPMATVVSPPVTPKVAEPVPTPEHEKVPEETTKPAEEPSEPATPAAVPAEVEKQPDEDKPIESAPSTPEKSEQKIEELTPEQLKRADKIKKKDAKKEKKRLSEIKKRSSALKRRSGTEGDLLEGEDDEKRELEALKKEEDKTAEEKGEEVSVPEDIAILLQTRIRGAMERIHFHNLGIHCYCKLYEWYCLLTI